MKDQRIEVILSKVKEKGIVSTLELTEELNVTEMTIRRDLKYLEDKKLLIRIHGGAKSIKKIQQEKLYDDRKVKYMKEKEHIAKIAASYIQDGETVFIAPGTTTERIPEFIKAKNVTVVTNSYSVMVKYSHLDLDFIVTGGRLRRKTEAIIDLKIWFDRLLKQLFRSKQAVGPGIMSAILKNIRKKLSGI